MSARRRRARVGIGRAAAIGAAAGLVGGVAMLLARTVEERAPRRGGAKALGRIGVERAVRRGARRASRRAAGSTATAAHLAYAAAIGAVYGLVHSRVRLPVAAEGVLLSAIAGAAGFPGARGVYGFTTTAVFRALAR